MSFVWPSLVLFLAFFAVAAIDGVYFHFRRFRLWAHAETRLEHALHTTRAVLAPPMIALLYAAGDPALVGAAVLVVLDGFAALADVAVERRSRERFGGLPHGEYLTHLAATAFHVAAIALAFAARLSADAAVAPPGAELARHLVIVMVAGSSLGAIHHVLLLARGFGGARRSLPTA
jgi:hypothetical protein